MFVFVLGSNSFGPCSSLASHLIFPLTLFSCALLLRLMFPLSFHGVNFAHVLSVLLASALDPFRISSSSILTSLSFYFVDFRLFFLRSVSSYLCQSCLPLSLCLCLPCLSLHFVDFDPVCICLCLWAYIVFYFMCLVPVASSHILYCLLEWITAIGSLPISSRSDSSWVQDDCHCEDVSELESGAALA